MDCVDCLDDYDKKNSNIKVITESFIHVSCPIFILFPTSNIHTCDKSYFDETEKNDFDFHDMFGNKLKERAFFCGIMKNC